MRKRKSPPRGEQGQKRNWTNSGGIDWNSTRVRCWVGFLTERRGSVYLYSRWRGNYQSRDQCLPSMKLQSVEMEIMLVESHCVNSTNERRGVGYLKHVRLGASFRSKRQVVSLS